MKKQIETELKELAITVLTNDSDIDISILKEQASSIYDRLCVLAYIEKNNAEHLTKKTTANISLTTPTAQKESAIIDLEESEPTIEKSSTTLLEFEENKEIIEEHEPYNTNIKEKDKPESNTNLLFELEELTADFKDMPEFEPAIPTQEPKKNINLNETNTKPNSSLNNSLKKGINIGLNDRLAFVKHLFNNNIDDYTRVISQLNTLQSSSGAKNFIEQMVKPEYNNWKGKEAFEERFISIVFSKFGD